MRCIGPQKLVSIMERIVVVGRASAWAKVFMPALLTMMSMRLKCDRVAERAASTEAVEVTSSDSLRMLGSLSGR